MDKERCAGGIVLGDGGMIAMVRHERSDAWLFPKGHMDGGETAEDAARREVQEETGIANLELIADLGSYTRPPMPYPGSQPTNLLKDIHMFLFAAPAHTTLSPSHEIGEAKWVSYREVASVIGNDKDRAWFGTVFERVREAIQRD